MPVSVAKPSNLVIHSQVLYSKYGFMYTNIELKEQEFILIREDDVIGIMPRSGERVDKSVCMSHL